jgi:hypothetical protein
MRLFRDHVIFIGYCIVLGKYYSEQARALLCKIVLFRSIHVLMRTVNAAYFFVSSSFQTSKDALTYLH